MSMQQDTTGVPNGTKILNWKLFTTKLGNDMIEAMVFLMEQRY